MSYASQSQLTFVLILIFLIMLSSVVLACNNSEQQSNKNNPLRQYINQPKDAAQAAKEKVETSQQETDKQLKELEGQE